MAFNNRVGSGFTNIQRYLGANQDNKLGSTINQGIQGQVQQTKNNLNQAQNQFQSSVDANKVDPNEGKNLISKANNPDAVTDADTNRFAQLRAGIYQGQTGLNNADQIKGQAQETQQLGQATGDQAGRYGLLQKFAGRGQYNQGQQRLDNLILGQTGQQDLNQARRATAGLGNQVMTAADVANQKAQQTQSYNKDIGSQLGQEYGNVNQDILNQAQAAADAATQQRLSGYKEYSDIGGRLSDAQKWLDANSGKRLSDYMSQDPYMGEQKATQAPKQMLSVEDLKKLGLSEDQFVDNLKINELQNIIKNQDTANMETKVNANQVATPEQLARANALAKLGKQDAVLKKADPAAEFKALTRDDLDKTFKDSTDYKNNDIAYKGLRQAQASAVNAFMRDVGGVQDESGGYAGLGRLADPGKTFLTPEQSSQARAIVEDSVKTGKPVYQTLGAVLEKSEYADKYLDQKRGGMYGGLDKQGKKIPFTPDEKKKIFQELAESIYQRNASTENSGVGNLAATLDRFKRLSDLTAPKTKINDVSTMPVDEKTPVKLRPQ